MKRILYALFLCALLLPVHLCAATELPDEDMALGGIRIGMTIEEVEELCGEPADFLDRMEGRYAVRIYDYGDTFRVKFRQSEGEDYTVNMVFLGVNDVNDYIYAPSEEAKSFETPRGIRLDSTKEDLEAAYGYLPKPKCSHNAPPVCGYFYDGDSAGLAFYICAEHSPGIRAIWLHEK